MQLILIQDVPHLGSLGDQVIVKDGYARNYLLPRGLAIMASSKNARQIDHKRKRLEVLRQQAIVEAQEEAGKVSALQLSVRAKAGANGRLFGSVTNRDIQAALVEAGYTVDRRSISLQIPIKSVGDFTVTVKLHSDVKTDVAVKVLPIGGDESEMAEGEAEEQAEAEGTGAAPSADAAPGEGDAATPSTDAGGEQAAPSAPADTADSDGAVSGTAADSTGDETPAAEGDAPA